MPFTDFTAGDVFTAANADVLMRQSTMTFADSSARDTALTGVLAEGLRAYLEDTDRLTVYDGAAWVVVSSPWAAYTPALANITLGNGSLDFRYQYVGWKSVRVRGTLIFGSTTSVSGTPMGFGYPDSVTPDSNPRALGTVWLEDLTGTDFLGSCQSASSIFMYSSGITPTSSTSPFTWANTDTISIDITFEIE